MTMSDFVFGGIYVLLGVFLVVLLDLFVLILCKPAKDSMPDLPQPPSRTSSPQTRVFLRPQGTQGITHAHVQDQDQDSGWHSV